MAPGKRCYVCQLDNVAIFKSVLYGKQLGLPHCVSQSARLVWGKNLINIRPGDARDIILCFESESGARARIFRLFPALLSPLLQENSVKSSLPRRNSASLCTHLSLRWFLDLQIYRMDSRAICKLQIHSCFYKSLI